MSDNVIDKARQLGREKGREWALEAKALDINSAVDVIADRWHNHSQRTALHLLDTEPEKFSALHELGLINDSQLETIRAAQKVILDALPSGADEAWEAYREAWRGVSVAVIEHQAETVLTAQRGPAYAAGVADGLSPKSLLPTPPPDCDHDEYTAGFRDGQSALIDGEESGSLQIF